MKPSLLRAVAAFTFAAGTLLLACSDEGPTVATAPTPDGRAGAGGNGGGLPGTAGNSAGGGAAGSGVGGAAGSTKGGAAGAEDVSCAALGGTCTAIGDCGKGAGFLSSVGRGSGCPGAAVSTCCLPTCNGVTEDFLCCSATTRFRPTCDGEKLVCLEGTSLEACDGLGGSGGGGGGSFLETFPPVPALAGACGSCVEERCAGEISACEATSGKGDCASAALCVRSSSKSDVNCAVEACVSDAAALAFGGQVNDAYVCLAAHCASECGVEIFYPCSD